MIDSISSNTFDDLTGKFLIAMPGMTDPRFETSVVYICAHSQEGAMGLIVNKVSKTVSVDDVFDQLTLERSDTMPALSVHYGGPVEMGRGFVLHIMAEGADDEDEGADRAMMQVSDTVAMTASRDILSDIAQGEGPASCLLCLGYAGWEPDQLEQEISQNAWLTCDAPSDILFETASSQKWDAALRSMGVEPAMLSATAGRA